MVLRDTYVGGHSFSQYSNSFGNRTTINMVLPHDEHFPGYHHVKPVRSSSLLNDNPLGFIPVQKLKTKFYNKKLFSWQFLRLFLAGSNLSYATYLDKLSRSSVVDALASNRLAPLARR